MPNHVKVIDNISNSILFQSSLENIDEAYHFATLMESEGLDIRLEFPTPAKTLINSLGISESGHDLYEQSLKDEIESHNELSDDDFGCTICPSNN